MVKRIKKRKVKYNQKQKQNVNIKINLGGTQHKKTVRRRKRTLAPKPNTIADQQTRPTLIQLANQNDNHAASFNPVHIKNLIDATIQSEFVKREHLTPIHTSKRSNEASNIPSPVTQPIFSSPVTSRSGLSAPDTTINTHYIETELGPPNRSALSEREIIDRHVRRSTRTTQPIDRFLPF